MTLAADVVILGALTGLTYGLLAAGLVLTFRVSGVLNLAHGQIGAFAAVALVVMVLRWGAPYWPAFAAALALAALVAMLVDAVVVRRLRGAPPLLTLVATLGVAEVLRVAGAALGGDEARHALVPQPPGLPAIEVGALRVTPASTAALVLGPVAIAGLAWLLRRSRYGLALRASAEDPQAARAAGLRARSYVTTAWGVAGALSALTAILALAAGGSPNAAALGPELLLRALAAAALAGMASLPGALAAGVAVGVVEAVARAGSSDPGLPSAVLLGVVLGSLLLRPPAALHRTSRTPWTVVEPLEPLPRAVRSVPLVRWAAVALGGAIALTAALLPELVGPGDEMRLVTITCFAIVGLSVWVLTGLAGELSLGQFALAGAGAAAAAAVARSGGPPALLVPAGALAGAALLLALGQGARRRDGPALAVVTLAFALAAAGWGLRQPWALGDIAELPALRLGPLDTSSPDGAFRLCATVLAGLLVWAAATARGRFGRRLRALRDNEAAARSLGVSARPARQRALATAGAIAGAGGALLALSYGRLTPEAFPAQASVDVVVMALVGGLAFAWGPLAGAVWIAGLPAFVELSAAGLAASATGWLVLLLYAPAGLAALADPVRRAGARALLRAAGHPWPTETVPAAPRPVAPAPRAQPPPAGVALELVAVSKRFGDCRVLTEAGLVVAAGEAVAVVGRNGAGKTTLADIACGLERADEGHVLLAGVDVTGSPPERRARMGLARGFQEGLLFPTLTARETVLLAADQRHRRDRDAVAAADAVLGRLGLEAYADRRVRTLSTGTRRLVELATLLVLEPRVLVLDEPAAGLAAPEVDRLGALLATLPAEGVALLLIEHDRGLVDAVAHRVLVMADGRLTPARPVRTPVAEEAWA